MKRVLRAFIAIFAGFLFGCGMVLSGMVFPEKVISFLDVTGQWDPSLMFVMGGALLVFMPSYLLFIKPMNKPLLGEVFSYATYKQIDKRLISGATIFGVGWGLAGICPGPTVSSLSFADTGFWVFFVSMMVGLGTTNRAFYTYSEIQSHPQAIN